MTRKKAILTFTNTLFYPLAPQIDEVKLEDIAHALSQMCRGNGHLKTFYSVAQHSINCAQEARTRGFTIKVQLACLLHDASEAYISDITRPVKYYLDEYRKIEDKLQQVIYDKFEIVDLTEEELKNIAEIDDVLLNYEFEHLHHRRIHEYSHKLYSLPDVTEKSMTSVESEFIQLTRRIMSNMVSESNIYKCVEIDSVKKHMEIRKISAEETWNLRQKVMWPAKSIEYVKLKDDDQGIHYGGFIESRLISVISVFYQAKQAQFRKFATCTEQQKQGYGTQLLGYVISAAKDMGADTIWCHARTDKTDFYQAFGLRPIGDFFQRDGKTYILMSKCLATPEMKDFVVAEPRDLKVDGIDMAMQD